MRYDCMFNVIYYCVPTYVCCGHNPFICPCVRTLTLYIFTCIILVSDRMHRNWIRYFRCLKIWSRSLTHMMTVLILIPRCYVWKRFPVVFTRALYWFIITYSTSPSCHPPCGLSKRRVACTRELFENIIITLLVWNVEKIIFYEWLTDGSKML